MVVTQISKIQVRRGRKGIDPIPQLAGGEFAWATDTQELYIGNGSIAEGSPTGGNTRVLTEHDTVLSLGNSYLYNRNPDNAGVTSAVPRSVQDRLDDGAVNSKNFGIKPFNGDCSDLLNAAINEVVNGVFGTSNETLAQGTRVAIVFDPGEYELSQTVVLPDNVRLVGSGKDLTTFVYTGSNSAFEYVPDTTAVNVQSRVLLSDFSIRLDAESTGIDLGTANHSVFENIKIHSTVADPQSTAGIRIENIFDHIVSGFNKFECVEFDHLTTAVEGFTNYSQFNRCKLTNLTSGIILGDPNIPANFNIVQSCVFDDIKLQGFTVVSGEGNISTTNIYKNVGATNSSTFAVTNVIKFVTDKNISSNDYFERDNADTGAYFPSVSGVALIANQAPRVKAVEFAADQVEVVSIPVESSTKFSIDYLYKSTVFQQSKQGQLQISFNQYTNTVNVTEEYDYFESSVEGSTSSNGSVPDSVFLLHAEVVSSTVPSTTIPTTSVKISYTNTNTGDLGTLTFSVSKLT